MPDTWIVAECALCGERRRYLPNDIFRGRLSDRLMRRPGRNGMLRWGGGVGWCRDCATCSAARMSAIWN